METFERDVNKKKTKGERGVNVLEHYAKPLQGRIRVSAWRETLRVLPICSEFAMPTTSGHMGPPLWRDTHVVDERTFGVAVNTFFLPDRGR